MKVSLTYRNQMFSLSRAFSRVMVSKASINAGHSFSSNAFLALSIRQLTDCPIGAKSKSQKKNNITTTLLFYFRGVLKCINKVLYEHNVKVLFKSSTKFSEVLLSPKDKVALFGLKGAQSKLAQ